MRMKRGAIVQLVRESARDGAYTTEVAATGTADATKYSELALIFFFLRAGVGSGWLCLLSLTSEAGDMDDTISHSSVEADGSQLHPSSSSKAIDVCHFPSGFSGTTGKRWKKEYGKIASSPSPPLVLCFLGRGGLRLLPLPLFLPSSSSCSFRKNKERTENIQFSLIDGNGKQKKSIEIQSNWLSFFYFYFI